MVKKVLFGLAILFAFGYGMLSGSKKIFPFEEIRSIYHTIKFTSIEEQNMLNESLLLDSKEVKSLIHIKSKEDLIKIRNELVNFIWGGKLPIEAVDKIEKNHIDTRYEDILSIDQIDKLTIQMDYGLSSYAYYFSPKKTNNKLMIFHQGHGGDFYESKNEIKYFIDRGYSVVAFSMPLLGMNSKPIANIGGKTGRIKLSTHNQMSYLAPKNGHNVRYFIDPVVRALNYLNSKYKYNKISMLGISGGGWTTTLVSAVDTRISMSFPVAGSLPIYLRSKRDWGDYEQSIPELYQKISYLELYILASSDNRKQLQIINKWDACCFGGTKSDTYKNIVSKVASDIGGGQFNILIDDTHKQHAISPFALNKIVEFIENN
jgi:hypothetical protein